MSAEPDPYFWRRPQGPVTPRVIDAAIDHMREHRRRESVGVVRRGRYVRLENLHPEPETAFVADAAALAGASAVVHSHPAGPAWPSAADMRGQILTGLPWAIVTGEGLGCVWGTPRPPLLDADGAPHPRGFCPGVCDCYTLIEDWYREARGVTLPPVPRDDAWWDHGQSLYETGFSAAGFLLVSRDPAAYAALAEPGDVYLEPVGAGATVPTHGGIYLGDGMCLEHHAGRLPRVRPIGPKLRRISHWLRHEGAA